MRARGLEGARIGLLTAAASPLGGGVAEAVGMQARMLQEMGAKPIVFALCDGREAEARAMVAPAAAEFADVLGPKQIGFAPRLVQRLIEAELDLLHLHGIWMYPSAAGSAWRRHARRPYLISPHGMLDPWIVGRGRAKKALARLGYERASWRAADAFHALTLGEAGDIARLTHRADAPWVIPNAGPRPMPAPRTLRAPNLLYLGRIHPKKNLSGLIEGWCLARRSPQARLTIAGWGDAGDVAELQRSVASAADETLAFVGPAFGEDKQRLLREARFLILPSHSEGLPMVVLEAWAAGTPALISEGCNLPQGYEANAALRCGMMPQEIAEAIERALHLEQPQWLQMAAAAIGLAASEFSAEAVGARWAQAYGTLLAKGRRA